MEDIDDIILFKENKNCYNYKMRVWNSESKIMRVNTSSGNVIKDIAVLTEPSLF